MSLHDEHQHRRRGRTPCTAAVEQTATSRATSCPKRYTEPPRPEKSRRIVDPRPDAVSCSGHEYHQHSNRSTGPAPRAGRVVDSLDLPVAKGRRHGGRSRDGYHLGGVRQTGDRRAHRKAGGRDELTKEKAAGRDVPTASCDNPTRNGRQRRQPLREHYPTRGREAIVGRSGSHRRSIKQ